MQIRRLDRAAPPVQLAEMDETISQLSFEEALKRLEAIVHQLESGDASLEDSIKLYTEGQQLKALCARKLADATARIEAITTDAAGNAVGTTAFDAGR
jgi:exodeoxyribonuclease VII small subunit